MNVKIHNEHPMTSDPAVGLRRLVGRHGNRLEYFRAYHRKRYAALKKQPPEKTCLECRCKFMPVKSDQKFHSPDCCQKFHNRENWADPERRNQQTVKFRAWRRKPENLARMRNHINKWREIPGNRLKQLSRQKTEADNLADRYVRQILGLPKKIIPLGLIAAKRECLKIKRLIKTIEPKLT